MSSRFPTVPHSDFCYSPVRISKNGRVFYVPCGKCNGCLLQKANSMSFRLGDEIENSSHSIFCTLTYDNIHVPKLECRVEDSQFHWFSAPDNWRYNGKHDVLRDPVSFYSPFHLKAPLKNYFRKDVIGYLSKSDIQLYLKLLRKDIYENFDISGGSLRYYIIGEYGPGKDQNHGKFRPHFHCIFFPCNKEIASYLLEVGLFKNWKMCDERRFKQYTKYCDSGTRHYVTEYVTGITYLPHLLRESVEIKPFALMSKEISSLGVGYFDKKKVCEDIERGVDSYYKRVSRIERNYIFLYSSKITNSLFPKCSRYSLLSFDGLLRVYEYLFNIRTVGYEIASLFNELSDFSVQDYNASKACLKVCDMMSWTPYHYVEVLVEFYYRKAMRALRYQYELQQQNIDEPFKIIGWYYNWESYLKEGEFSTVGFDLRSSRQFDSRRWFLSSFGLGYPFDYDNVKTCIDNSSYIVEVDDIIKNADKSKKANSLVGNSPHIV